MGYLVFLENRQNWHHRHALLFANNQWMVSSCSLRTWLLVNLLSLFCITSLAPEDVKFETLNKFHISNIQLIK